MTRLKQIAQTESSGISLTDAILVLAPVLWGVNFSFVKFALAEIPPLPFNGIRFLVAASTMLILAKATGHSFNFNKQDVKYLIGLGLLGNTAYQLLFIFGVNFTSADNASLILATVPAWVALIGTLFKVEYVEFRGWLGVGLSLLGVSLIIAGSNREAHFQFGGANVVGDLLVLSATLCWSGYTLLVRPIMRHHSSISVTSFSTLMGTIPLFLLATPSILQTDWQTVSSHALLALVFSGVFGIATAYFIWNFGISRLGSTRTALYSNLSPPVALLTAWLWLGETLTPLQLIGGVLALAGVVLARQFTRPVQTG